MLHASKRVKLHHVEIKDMLQYITARATYDRDIRTSQILSTGTPVSVKVPVTNKNVNWKLPLASNDFAKRSFVLFCIA